MFNPSNDFFKALKLNIFLIILFNNNKYAKYIKREYLLI